jgi:Glycosyl transferase family 2
MASRPAETAELSNLAAVVEPLDAPPARPGVAPILAAHYSERVVTRVPNNRFGQPDLVSPQVSVICTARNAAVTIAATIESILAQDMPDWEMIIVDDGSTDDTVAVVSRYARADPRIRLVTTGGIGRGRALNRAIAEAKADLVANLDADDESHPCRLRCQLEALKRHPEFDLLCTGYVVISGYGSPQWPDHFWSASPPVVDVTCRLMFENPVIHSSALMKKSRLRKVAGYSETRKTQLDYDLWVRLATVGAALGKIDAPLTARRIHEAQLFENRRRLSYILSSVKVQMRAIRDLGGGAVPFMTIPVRVVWGLLPAALREFIKGSRRDRRRKPADLPPSLAFLGEVHAQNRRRDRR